MRTEYQRFCVDCSQTVRIARICRGECNVRPQAATDAFMLSLGWWGVRTCLPPHLPHPHIPCLALPSPALSDMLVCVYRGKGTTSLINIGAPLFSPLNSAPISPPSCLVAWWFPGTRRKEKRAEEGVDEALGLIENEISCH